MADKKQKGSFGATMALLAILAAAFVWALVTPEYLMQSLMSEREFSMSMGGIDADRWIYTQSISGSMDIIKDSTSVIKGADSLPAPVKRWTQERVIVSWLWFSLITYRAYMLLLYFFALMPFVMALSMDGWGVREISMHRFSSQSPMKHRMGVVISNANLVFVAVWMVLPMPIPSVFAPIAILAMGVASWIWLSNLQKRI
jgi:hypothetical protein